jgi:glycosyltransferase involved in cell wall biosynthesis
VIKVLFIHQARIGSLSATGQLLSLLLEGLEDKFQLYEIANNIDNVASEMKFWDLQQFISMNENTSQEDLMALISDIAPQVLIFRPDEKLINLTDCIVKSADVNRAKLIGCVMDSWEGAAHNSILSKLFKSADALWFISQGMESYYRGAYEFSCKAFVVSNGVDIKHFKYPKVISKQERGKTSLKVIFTGSVNLNQTFEGLEYTANAIGQLNSKVTLNIITRQYTTLLAKKLTNNNGVMLSPPITNYDEYLREINQADVLLIPYGWSQEVLSYLKYSFGNKIPEYLACGVPIVVLGSKELNSVNYLLGIEGVKVITNHNPFEVQEELKEHFTYLLENYDSELEKSQRRKIEILEGFSIQNQRSILKQRLLSV